MLSPTPRTRHRRNSSSSGGEQRRNRDPSCRDDVPIGDFDRWLDCQLVDLEERFEAFVTRRSFLRSLRR